MADQNNKPSRIERAHREVEKARSGRWFYLVALVFFSATAIALGLWSSRIFSANSLRQELQNHLEGKNYEQAVYTIRKLTEKSPRWENRKLKARLAEVRLEWAAHELTQGNFAQAAAQAAEAGEDDHEGRLSDAIKSIRAGAAVGQLKIDLADLTFEERIARCRTIVSKFSGTEAANESAELLSRYEKISTLVRAEWEQLTKTVARCKEDGRFSEALALLQNFRSKCDKNLLQELNAETGRLEESLKSGFYEPKAKLELEIGTLLPLGSVKVLVAGEDFIPLVQVEIEPLSLRDGLSQESVQTSQESVFFTTEQGLLSCKSAKSGWPLWCLHQGLGMTFLPVVLGDDVVCASNWGRNLSKLNCRTRKTVWSVRFPVPLACPPLVLGNDVATLDQQGHLRIINAATGTPIAEKHLGGNDLSYIITDGSSRLVVAGNNRAILFEKTQDHWRYLGCLLVSDAAGEKIYLVGRYLFIVPKQLWISGRSPRAFIWRDRAITPVEKPAIEDNWSLLDQSEDVQVWVDSAGFAHCTVLEKQNVEIPLLRIGDINTNYVKDARFIKTENGLFLLVGGEEIELLSLAKSGGAVSLTKKWSKETHWLVDGLQTTDQSAGVFGAGQVIIVRGHDHDGLLFAGLSLEGDGQIRWISRPGPTPANKPTMLEDVIIWPDSEAGLLVIDAEGKWRHISVGLSDLNDPGSLSVVSDKDGCLAFSKNKLMLFGPKLERIWANSRIAPEPISAACLVEKAVVIVTDQGKLAFYDRASGDILSDPVAIPNYVLPCKALLPRGNGGILIIGHDGSQMQADIILEDGVPKWSFRNLGTTSPDVQKTVVSNNNVYTYTDAGWFSDSQQLGPYGPGLSQLLYADQNVILAANNSGDLACIDLAHESKSWKSKMETPALWGHRLPTGVFIVLNQAGQLLVFDPVTGHKIKQVDLSGTPMTDPAIFLDNIWIPLNGYRLVKLPLTEFD